MFTKILAGLSLIAVLFMIAGTHFLVIDMGEPIVYTSPLAESFVRACVSFWLFSSGWLAGTVLFRSKY